MNAYGPIFYNIKPNHVVFQPVTVHKWFQVNIDLKLHDNTLNDDRANIYGVMTENSMYPNIGSQIPAVFIQPNSMILEICMFLNEAEFCGTLEEPVDADKWFNLKVEQTCWLYTDLYCYIVVLIDNLIQFYLYNDSPTTFYDVVGVIGNTYGQPDIVVASGKYKNFNLNQSEDGTGFAFEIVAEPDYNGAYNVAY